jgi:hypothetical protein
MVCAAPALVRLWTDLAAVVAGGRGAAAAALMRAVAPAAVALAVLGINVMAFSYTTDRSLPIKRVLLLVKPYETEGDEKAVRAGLSLREFTADDAVIGVVWAGAIPYFSQRPAVDLLGKMDRRIAHAPAREPDPKMPWWASFRPGHMKWDYEYSIVQLKPDVVQAPLWRAADTPARVLAGYEPFTASGRWFVRKTSDRVHRDVVVSASHSPPALP